MSTLNKVNTIRLANYVLSNSKEEMEALKLQKVLFYIESIHLAVFNDSIIAEEFEAWKNGPVVRSVYDNFKNQSTFFQGIKVFEKCDLTNSNLTMDQLELIDSVINEYKVYDSWSLRNLTHTEAPWIIARKGYSSNERCTKIIEKTTMKKFYRKQLSESKNPTFKKLNNKLLDSITNGLMKKYDKVWVELAK